MGHVRSKTRSLGQILEKPGVHSRSHILSQIIIKGGQSVCRNEISDKFENGISDRKLSQVVEKPCVCFRGYIFSPIIMKLDLNVYLDEISVDLENESCPV